MVLLTNVMQSHTYLIWRLLILAYNYDIFVNKYDVGSAIAFAPFYNVS